MPKCSSCGTDTPVESGFCKKCGDKIFAATGQLSPNTILEGRYRYIIVEATGKGSMGAVYKALSSRLDNPVAIKEMSSSGFEPGIFKEAVRAFENEVAPLMSLKYPLLPSIIDFFSRGDDRWYLVMDFVEGETLQAVARRRGAIPENEVLAWAKQLCDVLGYLHRQNPPLVFKDLKPSHIMLTPSGRIKLTGFGLARHLNPGSAADSGKNESAAFSSPERLKKGEADQRSDIYSLGVILHYLLTGKDPALKPFKFDPPGTVVSISAATEKAVLKAVEFKLGKRPASVTELKQLLPEEADIPQPTPQIEAVKEPLQKHDQTRKKVPQAAAKSGRKKHKAFIWIGAFIAGLVLLAGVGYGAVYFVSYLMEGKFAGVLPGNEALLQRGQIGDGDLLPGENRYKVNGGGLSIKGLSAVELYITVAAGDSDVIFYRTPGTGDMGDDDVIGSFKDGRIFELIDKHNDIIVADGYTWWEVRDPSTDQTGWIAAAFLDKYENNFE